MTESSTDDKVTPDDVRALGLPLWARLAVVGVAVFALGGAAFVVIKTWGASDAPAKSAAVPAPTVFPAGPPLIPMPASLSSIDLPATASATEGPDMERLVDDVRKDLEARIDSLRALWTPAIDDLADTQRRLNKLEQAQQATDAQPASATAHVAEIAALRKAIETLTGEMDVLVGEMEVLGRNAANIHKLARQNARALKPKRTSPAQLPFTAQAIDWWGDQASLVVRAGDDTRFLATGQTLAGWQLSEIDRSGGRAVFERNGRRVNLAVPR